MKVTYQPSLVCRCWGGVPSSLSAIHEARECAAGAGAFAAHCAEVLERSLCSSKAATSAAPAAAPAADAKSAPKETAPMQMP